MTFSAHKLVHSEPFFGLYTYTIFDNCCQRYVATCGKNLYRCTSTFSALNCCSGIFFKSLSYLYEVVRENFSADFWIFFLQFLTAISRNLWRHLATKIRTT